jgi:pimeloyl-ACP methyl ester carboxylesterase
MGARLKVIIESGHFAQGEKQGKFNAALLDFLSQP